MFCGSLHSEQIVVLPLTDHDSFCLSQETLIKLANLFCRIIGNGGASE